MVGDEEYGQGGGTEIQESRTEGDAEERLVSSNGRSASKAMLRTWAELGRELRWRKTAHASEPCWDLSGAPGRVVKNAPGFDGGW